MIRSVTRPAVARRLLGSGKVRMSAQAQGFVQTVRSNGQPSENLARGSASWLEEGAGPGLPILERRAIEFDAEAVLRAVFFPGPGLAGVRPAGPEADRRALPSGEAESIELLFDHAETVESHQAASRDPRGAARLPLHECRYPDPPIRREGGSHRCRGRRSELHVSAGRSVADQSIGEKRDRRKPRAMSWRTPRGTG